MQLANHLEHLMINFLFYEHLHFYYFILNLLDAIILKHRDTYHYKCMDDGQIFHAVPRLKFARGTRLIKVPKFPWTR